MKTTLFSVFCFFCLSLSAQQALKEKFDACSTTNFSPETTSIIAKIDNKELVNVIFQSLDSQAQSMIEGYLLLQIVVGEDGHSCLQSMENKTNIPSDQMKIKSTIDSKLVWEKPSKAVSTMVLVVIGKNGVAVKRFGSTGKGWQLIIVN